MNRLKRLTMREKCAIALAAGLALFCWWLYEPVNWHTYRQVREGMRLDDVNKVIGFEGAERTIKPWGLPDYYPLDLQDHWGYYENYVRCFFPNLPGIDFNWDEFIAGIPPHHLGYQYREWRSRHRVMIVVFEPDGRAVGGAFFGIDNSWDGIMQYVRHTVNPNAIRRAT